MNDRRSTFGAVPPSHPLPHGGPAAQELGQGTGEEFVARIDLAKAHERFSAMLEAAANTKPEAQEAVERYEILDAEWSAAAGADADVIPPGSEVHEVYGTIRHFDASAGYGFIVPDNGLPEATIYATTLKDSGFSIAPLGATVACQIIEIPSGLRVNRVLAMDTSTATPPSELPMDEPYPAAAKSSWQVGAVEWFDPVRGFGYLSVEAQRVSIYCQIETMRRFGFFELRPGQLVEIRWGQTAKGPTVAEMRFNWDGRL